MTKVAAAVEVASAKPKAKLLLFWPFQHFLLHFLRMLVTPVISTIMPRLWQILHSRKSK